MRCLILLQDISKKTIAIACLLASGFINSLYAQVAPSENYQVVFVFTEDSSFVRDQQLGLTQTFLDSTEAKEYVGKLMQSMRERGYLAASVDSSTWQSNSGLVWLFAGPRYPLTWHAHLPVNLTHAPAFKKQLIENGWQGYLNMRELIIRHYENIGYPFVQVYLDSLRIINDTASATLQIQEGVRYKIDSIRLFGKLKLKNRWLQQQTGIRAGSYFASNKIEQADERMERLPFVKKFQKADVTYLGTGGILNLYLHPQKCSQVDALLGLQPAGGSSNKARLIGQIQLDLKNSFGNAESIFLQWQQLQIQSPRLKIGYAQPFVFGTSLGMEGAFSLFKKDSSFLQLQGSLLFSKQGESKLSTKLGFFWQQSSLLASAIDTQRIKQEKKFPQDVDLTGMNLLLELAGTQARPNVFQRKGCNYRFQLLAGKRIIRPNATILAIQETTLNPVHYYDSIGKQSNQLRFTSSIEQFFSLGKYATVMLGMQAGIFECPHVFRNDLFQLGGNKLLRGFDEESIFANRYLVATAEYRMPISEAGYIQAFIDMAQIQNRLAVRTPTVQFLGMGFGMVLPVDAGQIRLLLAGGKRSDTEFLWRQSLRIHLGFINYF